jgi:hypothetical protein
MVRVLRESNDDAMVAYFLQGELGSERFGQGIRDALVACGRAETLLTQPDLGDGQENHDRRGVLAVTRGYGEDREIFEHFPADVRWVWARLTLGELAGVRYIEYSYWNELSCGSRLPGDAARRVRAGVRPWGISHRGSKRAARSLGARGALSATHPRWPATRRACLPGREPPIDRVRAGRLSLDVDCLVGVDPTLGRWAQ